MSTPAELEELKHARVVTFEPDPLGLARGAVQTLKQLSERWGVVGPLDFDRAPARVEVNSMAREVWLRFDQPTGKGTRYELQRSNT